jgi:hypothetical protein
MRLHGSRGVKYAQMVPVPSHAEPPYDASTTPLSVVGYHSIVRTRPARGCRFITRQKASNDAEWLHVADAVIEAAGGIRPRARLYNNP